MKTSLLIASAVAATIAGPIIASAAGPAPDPIFKAEKCYGINAVGKNDCGSKNNSCAGQATKALDPNAWIYVPIGTCAKIEGGSTTPKKS